MKFFNKKELGFISSVLIIIFLISFVSYQASFRRARDNERDSDISNTIKGLKLYRSQFGFYPPSTEEGAILACADEDVDYFAIKNIIKTDKMKGYEFLQENARACLWGEEALLDVTDINAPAFITLIPTDPKGSEGIQYYYHSDGVKYTLLGSFEGKVNSKYSKDIQSKEISCGNQICNFGQLNE